MDIDKYYEKLEEIAEECGKNNKQVEEYLDVLISSNNPLISELIAFRKGFLSSDEIERVQGFLPIGYFMNLKGQDRITCFVICFEISDLKTKRDLRQRCELYSLSHPLFVKNPNLLETAYGTELLDIKAVNQIESSEILELENGFTCIERFLNPHIVTWSRETFPDRELFIRVNPYEYYEETPQRRLYESILMPANPNWWKKLNIHKGTKEGASYFLEDCNPGDNYPMFWEYRVKRINRLEVIAKRNNSGNLSMMLEELGHINENRILFGRCIHLDTDSPYETDFDDAILNHLDLAINVYEGEAAEERLNDNLANGNKSTDASYRTHLLRVEQIPFKGLFSYVSLFFKSSILVGEWFDDQFRGEAKS